LLAISIRAASSSKDFVMAQSQVPVSIVALAVCVAALAASGSLVFILITALLDAGNSYSARPMRAVSIREGRRRRPF
jgi:hypothetical protein